MPEDDLASKEIEAMVDEIMALEKKYAHEKRNIVTERRTKIREIIETHVGVEVDK